ncbi:hypothetical protein FB451DRAFT_1366313 [Mycena latifolia]|nr:hypothetical protein FB451DRAFT_1366313 [Mycena latifolia]
MTPFALKKLAVTCSIWIQRLCNCKFHPQRSLDSHTRGTYLQARLRVQTSYLGMGLEDPEVKGLLAEFRSIACDKSNSWQQPTSKKHCGYHVYGFSGRIPNHHFRISFTSHTRAADEIEDDPGCWALHDAGIAHDPCDLRAPSPQWDEDSANSDSDDEDITQFYEDGLHGVVLEQVLIYSFGSPLVEFISYPKNRRYACLVCKLWRDVIYASPMAWSHIPVLLYTDTNYVRFCVTQAKDAPVSLYLFLFPIAAFVGPNHTRTPPVVASGVFSILEEIPSRIQELSVQCPDSRAFNTIMKGLSEMDSRILAYLSISIPPRANFGLPVAHLAHLGDSPLALIYGGDSIPIPPFLPNGSSALLELRLSWSIPGWLSFAMYANLSTLRLVALCGDSFSLNWTCLSEILSAASRITLLEMDRVECKDIFIVDGTAPRLPHLTDLILSIGHISSATIVSHIAMPVVTSIRLDIYEPGRIGNASALQTGPTLTESFTALCRHVLHRIISDFELEELLRVQGQSRLAIGCELVSPKFLGLLEGFRWQKSSLMSGMVHTGPLDYEVEFGRFVIGRTREVSRATVKFDPANCLVPLSLTRFLSMALRHSSEPLIDQVGFDSYNGLGRTLARYSCPPSLQRLSSSYNQLCSPVSSPLDPPSAWPTFPAFPGVRPETPIDSDWYYLRGKLMFTKSRSTARRLSRSVSGKSSIIPCYWSPTLECALKYLAEEGEFAEFFDEDMDSCDYEWKQIKPIWFGIHDEPPVNDMYVQFLVLTSRQKLYMMNARIPFGQPFLFSDQKKKQMIIERCLTKQCLMRASMWYVDRVGTLCRPSLVLSQIQVRIELSQIEKQETLPKTNTESSCRKYRSATRTIAPEIPVVELWEIADPIELHLD